MTTKTTQKALAILLALVMLFSLIPGAAFADDGIELAEVELPIVEIIEEPEPAPEPDPAPEEIPEEPAADNIPDEPVGDDALGVPSEEEEEEPAALFMGLTLSDEERFETSQSVEYLDASGNTATESCTVVESNTWSAGWYVVPAGDPVTITGDVTFTGDVRLILADGAALTVTNGSIMDAYSENPGSLTVYGQSGGTGKLDVNPNPGGDDEFHFEPIVTHGRVTINGGEVTATGSNGAPASLPGATTAASPSTAARLPQTAASAPRPSPSTAAR